MCNYLVDSKAVAVPGEWAGVSREPAPTLNELRHGQELDGAVPGFQTRALSTRRAIQDQALSVNEFVFSSAVSDLRPDQHPRG